MIKILFFSFLISFAWADVTDTSQGTGCYASLYSESNFLGKKTIIFDGIDIPEWDKQVKSIIVGPKARLILYGKTFWKDRDYTIAPTTRVKNVETFPWNAVRSIKLDCVP